MVDFEGRKSEAFNNSICNRNVSVLVKMQGHLASLVKYEVFHYLIVFFMLMPIPSNFKGVEGLNFYIFMFS